MYQKWAYTRSVNMCVVSSIKDAKFKNLLTSVQVPLTKKLFHFPSEKITHFIHAFFRFQISPVVHFLFRTNILRCMQIIDI